MAAPALIHETTPGKVPPFVESLLPEGLAQLLKSGDARETLKGGRRYLSNIAVVRDASDLAGSPPDVLQAEAPVVALAEMPDGMPPALIAERFDIRRGPDDPRCLALEDLCSVLDVPAEASTRARSKRVWRALRPVTTDPRGDLEILLQRAL